MGKLPAPFLLFVFSALFTLIIPSAGGLSFNFTSFSPGDPNITYEGNASSSGGGNIQLTTNQRDANLNSSSGRATYHIPMQLWDKASGNLTDFTTHFSFSIDSQRQTVYADGLAFFLGPEELPPLRFLGEGLGLLRSNQPLNTTDNQFVAVEFDIFQNDFDPPREHVGIDINSMKSVNNITWECDIRRGKTTEAWISYNSSTNNLSVSFTGYINNTMEMQFLSYIVSLRDILPERVTFGFSASTGDLYAIHTLRSWDFSSSLEIDANVDNDGNATNPLDPAAASPPNNSTRRNRKKSRTGLAVGLGVGGGAIVVGAAMVGFVFMFMCRHEEDEEVDHVLEEYMDDEFERGTGPKKPINPRASNEDQVSMVHWVWELYGEGKLIEAVDPRLCGDFNKTQMERLMIVGLSCAHPDEHLRPSMRQSLHVLNFDAPLPILPSKMPVPSYFAPPLSSLSIMSYGSADSRGGMNESSSYVDNTNSSQITTSSSASSASAMLLHTG
ncbi:RECEPTOR LECTIN KINASE [Salix koriyanagi]|uniref:RECEPTOR LECTIN KINASE n=1 Tax=Salix koriyanagi TaxID=2511006 RepID=A0A9Q0X1X1_9ROSI|nr:RECEPTOR LECTIN KINASE [Salix koriyanagi]